jgi:HK97 family phage prohead protease
MEIRAEADKVSIGGYAAVFNSLSQDLGGFREVIRRGAFQSTIAGGADVRFLINHDGLPLARTKSGTLRLAEDDRGLIPKMKRGDLSQMSFGFRTLKDAWRQEGADQIRELHAVDLFDVSAVTYPAYQSTEVALRSLAASRGMTIPPGDPLAAQWARFELEQMRADGVSLRPSSGMAAAAREGLRLHEEGKSGDGLKPETVSNARKIAGRQVLTERHVREMNAWFARHSKASKSPDWDKAGEEKPGYVAWQLWGGNAAESWAAAKVRALDSN